MPPSSLFLVLRRLRAPLIALILIYALTIAGLVIIPGADERGHPVRMDFLHAFYFVSYTATTIGFGEIPHAFTDAQRLWVTFCIYLTVIGWSYAFVKLLALLQDPWFRQALLTQHFRLQVQRLTEPFCIVCAYGDTGSLLCRALDDLGRRFVVIDLEAARVAEVDVAGYRMDAPALTGDACNPEILLTAGLRHRCCHAVLALTNDDRVNLAIAAAARLLNPDITVLGRADKPATAADMALFRVDHLIDPHRKFGDYLAMAIESPGSYQLQQWLTGMPGTSLGRQTEPPRGHWIVYGEGLFADAVTQRLQSLDMTVVSRLTSRSARTASVAEPPREWTDAAASTRSLSDLIASADIDSARGFVAGSDDDIRNLSIVVAARQMKPDLFFVVRQNREISQALFEAFQSDITVTSSAVVVHECLARLNTPLLPRFLSHVATQNDAWADATLLKLRTCASREVPTIWTVELTDSAAPACVDLLRLPSVVLRLDHLIRDPDNREAHLPSVALMITRRDGTELIMPPSDTALEIGDHILFAGTPTCERRQAIAVLNVNVLQYVYFGRYVPTSWVWRKALNGWKGASL